MGIRRSPFRVVAEVSHRNALWKTTQQMSSIVPTVLATEPHEYREQVERASGLSSRIHIDLMDGAFAKPRSINPVQAWWPQHITATDIHLMVQRPAEHIETLVSLQPSLVILHAESDGDLASIIEHLQKFSIKVGLSLLSHSNPEQYTQLINKVDHILIFSGHLGHFGGTADLTQLHKIEAIKNINPVTEIGWDGGANESNVSELSVAGVDIINVGGAIQRADNPQTAYATLVAKLLTT